MAKEFIVSQFVDDKESEFSLSELNVGDNIKSFIENNISVTNLRTVGKQEDLQICNCSANLSFAFSDEFIDRMNENAENNFIISAFAKKIKRPIPFDFKLQLFEEGKNMHIEGAIPEEEIRAIYTVYALLNVKKNENRTEATIDTSQTETPPMLNELESDFAINLVITSEKAEIYNSANNLDKTKMYLIKGDRCNGISFDEQFYKIQYATKTGQIIEGYVLKSNSKLQK
ncbi:MAG: hypothetical protein V4541_05060 [Bacteroidota bacterium]